MLILSTAAAAQAITGIAHSIDADSLTLGNQGVRLFGIDAPEYHQTCNLDGADWTCREEAAATMRSAIDGRLLTCIPVDLDVYGRTVARCLLDGKDAAATMVMQGVAIVLDNGMRDYAALEEQAKRAKRGIWRSRFVTPADYRASRSQEPRPTQRLPRPSAQAPARTGAYPFRSCNQARAAGAAPMYRGHPTYNPNLDGNGEGIACEPYRRRR